MSTDDGSARDPEPSPDPASGPRPTVPLTALFVLAVGLIFGCALLRWADPRTDAQAMAILEKPVATSVRVLERDLSMHDALDGSRWRAACEIFLDLSTDPLRDVIDGYADVIAMPAAPPADEKAAAKPPSEPREAIVELRFRRVVLLAEAGRHDEARSSLDALDDVDPALCGAIRSAYGLDAARDNAEWPAALEQWQAGWARDRFARRIAESRGEAAPAPTEVGAARLRARLVGLALARGIPILLGLVVLCAWLLRNRPAPPQSTLPVPPPWSWQEGYAVLLISALAGLSIFLIAVVAASLFDSLSLAAWTALVASVPMLVWIRTRLLRPYSLTLPVALGVALPGGALAWIAVILAAFAAGEVGSAAIASVANALGAVDPHRLTIVERLIWCSKLEFAMWSADVGLWSPLCEEIGFRGLVFLTFRRRFGPMGAALLSSGLFGAIHAYGIAGQVAIFWKGLVFAASVELSRSLVPAIVCHALGNVLMLAAVAALYRA